MSLRVILFLFCCYFFLMENIFCEDGSFLLKVAKSVPRIGKRNKNANNDDSFEKFFLKASKSVPRIGRRGKSGDDALKNEYGNRIPFEGGSLKYPVWSELAERYEYEPELFISPQYLAQLEEYFGDDPSIYDWDKVKFKKAYVKPLSKELNEYKFQA